MSLAETCVRFNPGTERSNSAKLRVGAFSMMSAVITVIVTGELISFPSVREPLTTTVSSYLGGSSGFCFCCSSSAFRFFSSSAFCFSWSGFACGVCCPAGCCRGAAAAGIPATRMAAVSATRHTGFIESPLRASVRNSVTYSARRIYHTRAGLAKPCLPGGVPAESLHSWAEHRRRMDPEWASWPDDKLLDLRICDLNATIEGSALEERVAQLRAELAARGLSKFDPHFWLSAEGFSPDGVPGVAIPFYLAHPRLEKLERTQMLEVEGGTPEWCMKILRHEAGHAIDNGYKLRQRRRGQQIFGPSYIHYPDYYTPKPYSKSFVLHLDSWYAQSHPDEDFAETFAVWLNPKSDWNAR